MMTSPPPPASTALPTPPDADFGPVDRSGLAASLSVTPEAAPVGAPRDLYVVVKNTSSAPVSVTADSCDFVLAVVSIDTGRVISHDGCVWRRPFGRHIIAPGGAIEEYLTMRSPLAPGRYSVQLTAIRGVGANNVEVIFSNAEIIDVTESS